MLNDPAELLKLVGIGILGSDVERGIVDGDHLGVMPGYFSVGQEAKSLGLLPSHDASPFIGFGNGGRVQPASRRSAESINTLLALRPVTRPSEM
jgi:hypothetical protein